MPTLLAACIAHELREDAGSVGRTAMDKRPVAEPVQVRRLGLRGDVQADRADHGGLEKAVYAYAESDADYWQGELGRKVGRGWFGENLRVDGIDVSGSRPGDRWTIGSGTRPVELEVTMARTPCQTFARWVGGADESGWVKRFAGAGRLGAYLRVLRTGEIGAGDPIVVTSTADDLLPTITETFAASWRLAP